MVAYYIGLIIVDYVISVVSLQMLDNIEVAISDTELIVAALTCRVSNAVASSIAAVDRQRIAVNAAVVIRAALG